jgi:hypothetical protein
MEACLIFQLREVQLGELIDELAD